MAKYNFLIKNDFLIKKRGWAQQCFTTEQKQAKKLIKYFKNKVKEPFFLQTDSYDIWGHIKVTTGRR